MDNSTKLIRLKRFQLNLQNKLTQLKNQPTELEEKEIWIQEILEEASRWGLRNEVTMMAEELIIVNPDIDPVEAYQIAFNDWVK